MYFGGMPWNRAWPWVGTLSNMAIQKIWKDVSWHFLVVVCKEVNKSEITVISWRAHRIQGTKVPHDNIWADSFTLSLKWSQMILTCPTRTHIFIMCCTKGPVRPDATTAPLCAETHYHQWQLSAQSWHCTLISKRMNHDLAEPSSEHCSAGIVSKGPRGTEPDTHCSFCTPVQVARSVHIQKIFSTLLVLRYVSVWINKDSLILRQ